MGYSITLTSSNDTYKCTAVKLAVNRFAQIYALTQYMHWLKHNWRLYQIYSEPRQCAFSTQHPINSSLIHCEIGMHQKIKDKQTWILEFMRSKNFRPSCSHGTGQVLSSHSIQWSPFKEHISEEGERPLGWVSEFITLLMGLDKYMSTISCIWNKPEL